MKFEWKVTYFLKDYLQTFLPKIYANSILIL